jgi:hypothetical protein
VGKCFENGQSRFRKHGHFLSSRTEGESDFEKGIVFRVWRNTVWFIGVKYLVSPGFCGACVSEFR